MTASLPANIPYLYLAQVDLYRVGSAASPKLDKIRPNRDVDLFDINGVRMVHANGKGVSLFTEEETLRTRFESWAWKIPTGTTLPPNIGFHNDHPGHFMICPTRDMTLYEYVRSSAGLR